MLEVGKILDKYAYKSGKDHIRTWNDWLVWLTEVFEWQNMTECGGVIQTLEKAKDDNLLFFEAMVKWLEIADDYMRNKGAFDAFGQIYEECYQSKYKASNSGQFFTPMSLSLLLAKVTEPVRDSDGIATYYDCACGSGRLLIAGYDQADKYAKNWFEAGDIDDTSVRMCALNFMLNGMVGKVENRNALTMEFRYGFVVNACKVPITTPACSLQYFDDEAKLKRYADNVRLNMKHWDIGKYKPNDK